MNTHTYTQSAHIHKVKKINHLFCVYMRCVYVHASVHHHTSVQVRGKLVGISSLLSPCGPGDQTQVNRIVRKCG